MIPDLFIWIKFRGIARKRGQRDCSLALFGKSLDCPRGVIGSVIGNDDDGSQPPARYLASQPKIVRCGTACTLATTLTGLPRMTASTAFLRFSYLAAAFPASMLLTNITSLYNASTFAIINSCSFWTDSVISLSRRLASAIPTSPARRSSCPPSRRRSTVGCPRR